MGFLADGRAHGLVDLAAGDRKGEPLFDLQLRRDTKGANPISWASLYYGLTSVLDLEERGGQFRIVAHKTHRTRGGFDDAWSEWQEQSALDRAWPSVAKYIASVTPTVDKRWTGKEGAVHAAISSGTSDAYRVVNREVSPAFSDQATKDAMMASWWRPIDDALRAQDNGQAWWPRDVKIGASPTSSPSTSAVASPS